jgi:hypothetical protein
VFDSSAKIPSGLLNGNVNQYGDFDQCLDVKTELDPLMYPHLENYSVLGKYCLATFDLDIRKSSASSAILLEVDDLIHAHRPLISTVNDVSLANSLCAKLRCYVWARLDYWNAPVFLLNAPLQNTPPHEFDSLLNYGSYPQVWALILLSCVGRKSGL